MSVVYAGNYATIKNMKNEQTDNSIKCADGASKEPVSMENIPLALGYIIDDVAEFKDTLYTKVEDKLESVIRKRFLW